jgi:hypothetical protein
MQTITVEIQDDETAIIYTIPTVDYPLMVEALASMVSVKQVPALDGSGDPILDDEDQPTTRNTTVSERVIERINTLINKDCKIYQLNNVVDNAQNEGDIKTVIVT